MDSSIPKRQVRGKSSVPALIRVSRESAASYTTGAGSQQNFDGSDLGRPFLEQISIIRA
jgi:hypothetical protein